MNAKEMFEELGYEICRNDDEVIVYSAKKFISETNYIKIKKIEKEIDCYILSDSPFEPTKDLAITFKELKAINKQVEELGWLDNDN